jgi:uncharacterized protein
MPLADRFLSDIQRNPHNLALLEGLPALGLPDCWLVAGCLFQTVWNLQSGAEPTAQINDYDVFYFDGEDLSAEAEKAVQARVNAAFAHLPIRVEAMNQARVHLWYEGYFHEPYSALSCSQEGIGRYLVACTCVGVRREGDGRLKLAAPFGLEELYGGVMRPNWVDRKELYTRKCESYARRWPHLRTIPA